ncbi:unnamed protein product [Acanthoscelides obtectus]|uniref:DDE Tnp4 domain-containing protein n=1 Tax=Acanthoscelides obtectus TaxID=200917 RepID=A0A9P0KS76_ACAOB|nr:unnamed protein product [Acanthoscelides obtectus]CAK1641706.1 Putative nuclease HARBI1 [Acanthoscelides obtectus]
MSRIKKIAAASVILITKKRKNVELKNKKRRMWVRSWISRRQDGGFFAQLVKELHSEDMNSYGDSYHSLQYLFRIPVTTISRIIPEVCEAIFTVLKTDYLQLKRSCRNSLATYSPNTIPNSQEEWYEVAKGFEEIWNFPNCLGALDGKHVVMKAPRNKGSLYFNYKGTHSIVLMALVDAKYKFLYVDVGWNGQISDRGVYPNCSLSRALENNMLNMPKPRPLPGESEDVPFVVISDDAFALTSYLLKPFPFKNQPGFNRVFNYRISRARRVVENAFGLISARFRVLRRPIDLPPEKIKKIVLAICSLHNFLLTQKSSAHLYAPNGIFDTENDGNVINGSCRNGGNPIANMVPLQATNVRNPSKTAKEMSIHIKKYKPSTQSGFKPGHSTVTALIDVSDDYLRAIDDGNVTTCVMLDLSNAFDCIHPRFILAKLPFFGFSAPSPAWFSSYLSGRSQMVKLGAIISLKCNVMQVRKNVTSYWDARLSPMHYINQECPLMNDFLLTEYGLKEPLTFPQRHSSQILHNAGGFERAAVAAAAEGSRIIFDPMMNIFAQKNKFNLFNSKEKHDYQTRSKNLLIPPQHPTAAYQKSLTYMGCEMFNNLKEDIQKAPTLSSFKI